MLNKKQILKLTMAALTINIGFTGPVSAKTIANAGDWTLDDSNPGDPNSGGCTASTATYLGSVAYSLNVVLDKSGVYPLEFYIAPLNGGASNAKGFSVAMASGKEYQFVRLPRTKNGRDVFWNIPHGTDNLVEVLKAIPQFGIDEVNGQGELPFSMSGSSSIINSLQKSCMNSKTLFKTGDFETAFLPAKFPSISFSKLTTTQADAAHTLVANAVVAYRGVQKVKQEMQDLEAHYAALNAELAALKSSLKQLINIDLVDLVARRDKAQATIDNANSEIANLKIAIAAKQIEVASAQSAYNDAVTTIKPFVPEHDRLLSLKQNDQSRLANAQNNLANILSNISDDQNRIQSLNDEAQNLNNSIPGAQDQLNRAQGEKFRAQSELRNFNAPVEIAQRMASDRRLLGLNSDISSLQSQFQLQNQQLSFAQTIVEQKASALRICNGGGRAPNAVADDGTRGPRGAGGGGRGGMGGGAGGDGQGRGPGAGGGFGGGRPGGPGGPGPAPVEPPPVAPPPVAPPPVAPPVVPVAPPAPVAPVAPNCSAQQAELITAQNNLSNAQQVVSQNLATQTAKTQERDQVSRFIEQDVYHRGEELNNRDQRASYNLTQAQNQVDGMVYRLSQINNTELPNTQNDLNQLMQDRVVAGNELAAATAALNSSTVNYDNYKVRVNYDALKAIVDRTGSALNARQGELASLNSQVSQRVNLIATQTTLRDSLIDQIATMRALILSKQTRQATVEGLLVPYNSDKQAVNDKLTAAQKILTDITVKFDAQLPKK